MARPWDEFYTLQYGSRWAELSQALTQPQPKIFRLNDFLSKSEKSAVLTWLGNAREVHPGCYQAKTLETPLPKTSLTPFYEMDLSSVLAAEALAVRPGHHVLDLCAAPGGKALILAEKSIRSGDGLLVANDLSAARLARMKSVFREYVPSELMSRIQFKKSDATRWFKSALRFDRILLDVPCSSERHVLGDKKEFAKWSVNKSKTLSKRQYAILCSALELLNPGGLLLYSTCSVSKIENEDVIERLLTDRKRTGRFSVKPLILPIGEATSQGWKILPDHQGYGPGYGCLISSQ